MYIHVVPLLKYDRKCMIFESKNVNKRQNLCQKLNDPL